MLYYRDSSNETYFTFGRIGCPTDRSYCLSVVCLNVVRMRHTLTSCWSKCLNRMFPECGLAIIVHTCETTWSYPHVTASVKRGWRESLASENED